ncbi:MAG: ATP synthase subunit C [Candidatus Bathyarchaeia archaeon]
MRLRNAGILAVSAAVVLTIVFMAVAHAAEAPAASQETTSDTGMGKGIAFLAAALAIGAPGFAAAMAMGTASSAAIGALAERPEVFGRTLIYIVFIEAIAIYGMVVSLLITMKLLTF